MYRAQIARRSRIIKNVISRNIVGVPEGVPR